MEFFNLKKRYRKEIKLVKKRYNEKVMNHLDETHSSNPKECGDLIEMITNSNKASKKTSEIDSMSQFSYFKNFSSKT